MLFVSAEKRYVLHNHGYWRRIAMGVNEFSSIGFGYTYTNDTGLDGKMFFTGSKNFKVKEIEVFEITD
jgi:hypothetical protein